MKSIEKLRYYAKSICCLDGDVISRYADEIEREIAEKYMELPVDADGVLVEIGDKLHDHEHGHEFPVDGLKIWGSDCSWWAYQENGVQAPVLRCTHVNPRTVEDVLREFGDWYVHVKDGCDEPGVIADYAAEIRELLSGDAE